MLEEDPIKILQGRYARGEINSEEYNEILNNLKKSNYKDEKSSPVIVNNHFCRNCGSELRYNDAEICPTCGIRIKSSHYEQQSIKYHRPLILGIIGGILGLFGALYYFYISAFITTRSTPLNMNDSEIFIIMGSIALIFSLIGVLSGAIRQHKMGGTIMIISGIVVGFTSIIGILGSVFFIIGGILKYRTIE